VNEQHGVARTLVEIGDLDTIGAECLHRLIPSGGGNFDPEAPLSFGIRRGYGRGRID
jgi:hypothetical protein